MEHLFSPAERQDRQAEIDSSPSVLWLGFNHDAQGRSPVAIEDYPLHRGWTREALQLLELGQLGCRPPHKALAMIQSWMSFGLLESAFNAKFRIDDFVKLMENGKKVVQTISLREWIDGFRSRVDAAASRDDPAVSQQRARLIRSLEYAAHWNQKLFNLQKENETPWTNSHLFGPVTRMITLIAEAVWAVGQFMPSTDARPFIQLKFVYTQVNEHDLRRRVARRGWCPSLFDKIMGLSRTSLSALEYISVVPPFREARNQHRGCSTEGCVEYNVSDSDYPEQHRAPGCKCERVIPPLQAVVEALMNGTVPIIDGVKLLHQEDNIVQRFKAGVEVPYIAISHVWSDGLGGTTEKGMLKCQIEYLVQVALQIGDTSYIWIDSLCIPAEKKARKVAISMMAETYKKSYRTLVLDKGIMNCRSTLSLERRMLALSLSTWQERLWTLQESSLCCEVRFILHDALMSADDIMLENRDLLHRPVLYTFYTLLDNLTYWVKNNLMRSKLLAYLV